MSLENSGSFMAKLLGQHNNLVIASWWFKIYIYCIKSMTQTSCKGFYSLKKPSKYHDISSHPTYFITLNVPLTFSITLSFQPLALSSMLIYLSQTKVFSCQHLLVFVFRIYISILYQPPFYRIGIRTHWNVHR